MIEDENMPSFPEITEIDLEILKAKEAHFSGSFPLMIEYYQNERPGLDPEFTIESMQRLDAIERQIGTNLSSLVLSDEDREELERSKEFYEKLRQLYRKKKKNDSLEILIADLILSEEPQKEIKKIAAHGKKAVPFLIALIQNEDLKNPLFPGYGNAPQLAVECLREIHDDSTIFALFELIGHVEVVDEEGALLALKEIGEPAMKFLLKVVSSVPITFDNERAAVALIHFKEIPEVSEAALHLLEEEMFRKSVPLSSYLALIAADVGKEELRKRFLALAMKGDTPLELKKEIELIARTWK